MSHSKPYLMILNLICYILCLHGNNSRDKFKPFSGIVWNSLIWIHTKHDIDGDVVHVHGTHQGLLYGTLAQKKMIAVSKLKTLCLKCSLFHCISLIMTRRWAYFVPEF